MRQQEIPKWATKIPTKDDEDASLYRTTSKLIDESTALPKGELKMSRVKDANAADQDTKVRPDLLI